MTAKMTDEEYRGNLKKFRLEPQDACHMIENKTGVTIRYSTVKQHIDRYGSMSKFQTIAFRLLFKLLEESYGRQTRY